MIALAEQLRAATGGEARMRWIDRLAREWHGREPRGYAKRSIDAAEKRLGIEVPQIVRRWYASLARTQSIAWGQSFVVAPRDWEQRDGALTIGLENQDNWLVTMELAGEDPPVRVVGFREGALSRSFSTYAVQLALHESVLGAAGGAWSGKAEGARPWLVRHFGEPVVEPWPDAGYGPVDFYVGALGLALHEARPGNEWLFLALRDDGTCREVARSAPIVRWFVGPQ